MHSNLQSQRQSGYSLQAIDALRAEHASILEELADLTLLAKKDGDSDESLHSRTEVILELLERHQADEERYLFPLLFEPGSRLSAELRSEHSGFVGVGGELLSIIRSGGQVAGFLDVLRMGMAAHFRREESIMLDASENVLSPAQLDILRMKLTPRKRLKV